MAKILIATIQVNLCCLTPASLGINTNSPEFVVIKIFAINLYHHSHLLAAPFDFTTFFHTGHFEQGCTTVQLEPVTIQLDSRSPVDRSARSF